jgi:hypothetical protein
MRWAAVAKGNTQQQHAPAARLQLHARRRPAACSTSFIMLVLLQCQQW